MFPRLHIVLACTGLLLFPQVAHTQTDPAVRDALAALRVAAERGDAVAQLTLGSWLYHVAAGPADVDEAASLFKKAAENGSGAAAYQVGMIYDLGMAQASATTEAIAWYQRAADLGYAPGMRTLANCYRDGRGVPPDLARAAELYRQAADRGDLLAQYHLGQMYVDGVGVEKSHVMAYLWFDRAAAQTPLDDNRKGLLELRNLEEVRMSDAERSEAERLARAWAPLPR